jgi:hypothetical protein
MDICDSRDSSFSQRSPPALFVAAAGGGMAADKGRFRRPQVPGAIFLVIVILTKLADFVVLPKVTIFTIFPDVASAGVEERVVTPAIRELDTDVLSLRHGGLRLK